MINRLAYWLLTALIITNTTLGAAVLPRVIGVFPQRDSRVVGIDRLVGATFNTHMDPESLTNRSFSVMDEFGTTVHGTVIYDKAERRVFFKPAEPLKPNTLYTAVLASYLIRDAIGRPLSTDESWSFRTLPDGGMAALDLGDRQQPRIMEVLPARGASAVPEDGEVAIRFNKPVKPGSLNSFSLWLEGTEGKIPVRMLYSDVEHSVRLIPLTPMKRGKRYKVTITDAVEDLNGNYLANPLIWYFFTRPEADIIPPEIVETSPLRGAREIRRNAEIMITFSEPMDKKTVNTKNIVLSTSAGPVPGIVSVNRDGNKAAFSPELTLSYGTLYTLDIKNGVTDAAGNPLSEAVELTFSTEKAPDIDPPVISATWPVDEQKDVPRDARIRVHFNEPIMEVSVNKFTVFLKDGSRIIPSTLNYDEPELTVTVLTDNELEWDTDYVLTVTRGIKDIPGNSMEQVYEAHFRTLEAPDLTGPEVAFTNPENHAVGVMIRPRIEVDFNKPVETSTLTEDTVVLTDEEGNKIPGTFNSYDKTISKLIFVPNRDLDYEQNYTFGLAGDIRCFKGNKMEMPFRIHFTTMPQPDRVPPKVIHTSPLQGAMGVSLSTNITATFSEPVEPVTLNEFTVALSSEGMPVSAQVHYDRLTNKMLIEPSMVLTYGKQYVATIRGGVRDLAGNPMGNDYVFRFTMQNEPDRTPPRVALLMPADGAVDVPVTSRIYAKFNEAIHDITLNEFSIALHQNSKIVPGVIRYDRDENSVTFVPARGLDYSSEYSLVLSTEIRDLSGNQMGDAVTATFSTVAAPNIDPPRVISTRPETGEDDVEIDIRPQIEFSETLMKESVNSFTVSLRDGNANIESRVILEDNRITVIPSENLAFETKYHLVMSRMIQDMAGNNMAATEIITFITSPEPDAEPPRIISVTPSHDEKKVIIGAGVTVQFSEPVESSTVNDGTFVIQKDGEAVLGSIVYMPERPAMHFQPAMPLEYSTEYRILISDGIRDLRGNALERPVIMKFTTQPPPDTVRPAIASHYPEEGQKRSAVDKGVWAVFTKDMDPETIDETSFALYRGLDAVNGFVTYSETTRKALFMPERPLNYETVYRVIVSNRVKCTSGNLMASVTAWEFTTEPPPDTIPPRAISTHPKPGEIMLPDNVGVLVTFSEPVRENTINNYTFMITGVDGQVEGEIRYNAEDYTVNFRPSSPMRLGSKYRLNVTEGIQDLSGNGLENPINIDFYVGHETDRTPPTVIITVPEAGGSNVSVSERITATFSKRIDPMTLNSYTVIVNDGSKNIEGKVEYRDYTRQVIFTPQDRLETGTNYKVTLTAAIRDINGNQMKNAHTFIFRTAGDQL